MNSSMKAKQAQLGDLMKDFIDRTLALYGDMKDRPVSTPADTDALERISGGEIPAEGRPVETVYSELLRDVYASTALAQHPRSFACIPGPASLFSWMGDVMTSAYNPHASCKVNAPAAACVEKRLIRWMCGLAGYPEATAGGLFVSGGSIANLTALTAARDAKLTDAERAGAAVYISDQTHSSLAKALHIIGFRADQIRKIPSDADFRMDLAALRAQIEADISAGCRPFAVIASAGTTNTGSVDPLPEIAALCRERDMWMHVDGAFGASALLSERQREKLAGIELSDSLSWDAHKWMMQTYACSVVLVRDQACLVNSFAAHPEYLKDAESDADSVEFWDLGPELTRPARGLKLWSTLQVLGSRALGDTIDHACAMAELAEKTRRRLPNWEIVSRAQFGIINFRYVPENGASPAIADQINRDIAREITASGFAQIFTTEIHGRKVLRICTLNPETTAEDITATIERLNRSRVIAGTGSGGGTAHRILRPHTAQPA